MRAAAMDRRIEAIAGPAHFDVRGSDFGVIPETVDVPLTVATVVTSRPDSGGRYIFNSPIDSNGRRAYLYTTGVPDGPPHVWATGSPATSLGTATPGLKETIIGVIPHGIPRGTAVRDPEWHRMERLIIWPRKLTTREITQVRALLEINSLV